MNVKQKFTKQDKGKGRATDEDRGGAEELVTDEEEDAKDSRAVKKQKFQHDYSFLAASCIEDEIIPSSSLGEPSSSTFDPSQSNVPYSLPVPSSDLLKCVHYFASEYYAAHGQLSDIAKEVRKEARTLKKNQLEGPINQPDEEVVILREDDGGNEEQPEETKPKRRGGRKAGKKWAEARLRRDMYKAFDGSALMAIGMLLQEHVAEVMSASPPDGWEEQMEAEEAQESLERQVKGGKRRRKKENKSQERMAETEDEKGGVGMFEGREESEEESSTSSSTSSSSSEISSTESDDDSESSESTNSN